MVRSGDVGASELNVSASGVAEGVFTFVLVKANRGATTRGGRGA